MRFGSIGYWLRGCYVLAWLAMLAYFLLAVRTDELEPEAQVLLLWVLQLVGAPISYLASGLLIAILRLAPDAFATAVNSQPFGFMWITWWIVLFALSYWQWFYAVPWLLMIFKRWTSERGGSRK